MQTSLDQLKTHALQMLIGVENAAAIAQSCAWLEACGYPGIKLLHEAVGDERKSLVLDPDAMGLDLQGVSCVFLGHAIDQYVQRNGRVFLRNVRHGLYLLPLSVAANIGIGCPIDLAFAYGGERTKNPYVEKLEAAMRDGVTIPDDLWQALETK